MGRTRFLISPTCVEPEVEDVDEEGRCLPPDKTEEFRPDLERVADEVAEEVGKVHT